MSVENIPISQLPATTTAADSDVIAIDNGTTTKKITVENFNATGTASAQAAAAAAAQSATDASNSATAALGYKNTVQSALNDASTIVSNAQTYANSAESSKNDASGYASAASTSASQAATSAGQAASYATGVQAYAIEAKSWAEGGTGTRVDEETTNCSYLANAAHTSETNAATSETNAATSETNAAASESNAATSESNAEAWAVGERGGVPVGSSDETYWNNAKYYSGAAYYQGLKAEGYAGGTQEGIPVTEGQPYFHDNAQYYSEAASMSKLDAQSAAYDASQSATAASGDAEDSEAWAWGKIDGVDVPATHPAYHNNAKYWADAASGGAGGGVTSFNGRSGIVVPAASDYSASLVDFDNTSNSFTADDVQEAIEEVQANVGTVASDLSTLSGSLATVATSGSYSDLSNKPTLGTAAAKDSTSSITQNSTDLIESGAVYTETSKAYKTDDTAETTLADADYIPFYDTSASGKRKSLWSNIKSVLKTYFDTLYKGISAHDSWSDVTSKPFSSVGDGLTVTSNVLKADIKTVTVGTTGTASSSATNYQRIGVNGSYTEVRGSKYMETTTYTTSGSDRVFTFTNVASDAVIDGPYCDVIGVSPTAQTHSGTTYTVSFASSDAVGKVRIYLK